MIGNVTTTSGIAANSTEPTSDEKRVAVFQAVLAGDQKKVEGLLKTNPELIHAKTNTGSKTLLHIAAGNGHESLCRFLLSKNHKTNPTNSNGITPYQIAKTDDIRRLLVEAHKIALCKKFYTAGKVESVEVMAPPNFKKCTRIAGADDAQIIFGATLLALAEIPNKGVIADIKTFFREDILMMPYYGELLVIHENVQVEQMADLSANFLERKTSVNEIVKVKNVHHNFIETNAYLMFVSKGLELFPFLRDYPTESDNPAVVEAKKMFLTFGVISLHKYYLGCSDQQKQTLKFGLRHFAPTMEHVGTVLDESNKTKNKAIFDEVLPKYRTST